MTQRVAASALGTSDTALTSSTVRYAVSGLNRYTTVTTEGGSAEVLEYDAVGRISADVHRRYEWDADGRLREVRAKSDDRLLARYTYDALKRRASRTVWSADSASSATVLYVWDGDHVVEERLADGANSGLGTLVAEYVWGAPAPNGLLAQRRTASHPDYSTTLGVGTGAPGGISGEPAAGALTAPAAVVNGEWTLPVVDHLGHLRVVMAGAAPSAGEGGGSGSGGAPPAPAYVLERRGLSAFGLPRAVSSATGLPLVDGAYVASGTEATALFDIAVPSAYGPYLLTGHAWDPAAAQHYAWHRWVSPRLGRFSSPSPLTYPIAELNYEWVGNSPYQMVDVDGRQLLTQTEWDIINPNLGPTGYVDDIYGAVYSWHHPSSNLYYDRKRQEMSNYRILGKRFWENELRQPKYVDYDESAYFDSFAPFINSTHWHEFGNGSGKVKLFGDKHNGSILTWGYRAIDDFQYFGEHGPLGSHALNIVNLLVYYTDSCGKRKVLGLRLLYIWNRWDFEPNPSYRFKNFTHEHFPHAMAGSGTPYWLGGSNIVPVNTGYE